MKKSWLIILVSLCLFASCENEKNLYEGPETPSEIVSKHVMTTALEIPDSPEGKVTVVKLGNDVIYEGNIPTTIQVPKFNETNTRSEDITWAYEAILPGSGWYATYKEWGVLMFEDLTVGDTDYNDFICGVVHTIDLNGISQDNYNFSGSNIRIKPMAMGNTLDLKFGIQYRKADGSIIKEIMITEDVRSYYFDGVEGYINTKEDGVLLDAADLNEKPSPTADWGPVTVSTGNLYTLWFIESKGVRRYAANAGAEIVMSKKLIKDELVTKSGAPFGLFVPDRGLLNMPGVVADQPWKPVMRWPIETKSIYKAYPNFKGWLIGENDNPFAESNEELLFDKTLVNF